MTTQPPLFDDDPAPQTETACWRIACAACGDEIARTTW